MMKGKREKMRLSIIMICSFLGASWLYASDIDAQIAKIQQASPQERYKLVNQLKEQIAHLNALEQARSISKYQESSLNHQEQQAIQANQLSIEETLKRQQTDNIFVPQNEILPKTTPKILPLSYPTKQATPKEIDVPTPQPTFDKPDYEAPASNYDKPSYQAPTPTYDEPSYKAPTPQPSYDKPDYEAPASNYDKPSYEAPTPTYDEPSYEAPTPQPSYDKPDYEAPASTPSFSSTTSKRGGF